MATAKTGPKNSSAQTSGAGKKRPFWTKGFPVTVAAFEFEKSDDNGPPNVSVAVTKAFRREATAAWEYSNYLDGNDLLRAAKLLEEADAVVQSRREEYYQSRTPQDNGSDGF